MKFAKTLSRDEMKNVTAGYMEPEGNCSGCANCLGEGCSADGDGAYCGMIQDTRDGSYTRCYK